jgi:hypothetical protein
MNGTSGAVGLNPGSDWKAVATGDFNGDGDSDILLQSADGQVAIWEMNGTNVIGGGTVSSVPGASLASDRNWWRRLFRHPSSKHERSNRDLGHERDRHNRQRAR